MVFKRAKSEKNPGHHGPEPHQKLAPAALAIQADGIKSY